MEGVKPVARRQLVDIHSSALMTTEDPVTSHGHAGDVGQSFRQGQLQGLVGWMPILGAPPQRTCIHLACKGTMRFGSTAKVLAKCKLKYYRISECRGMLPVAGALMHPPCLQAQSQGLL